MRLLDLAPERASVITEFGSRGATALPLGHGSGEAHAYVVRIEADGRIPEHVAGFDQLFVVIEGAGWVKGGDGTLVKLSAGQGVHFERGERHAKGSDVGMTAVMIQVSELTRDAAARRE